MPASLPTENALGKAVNEFGVGTYDSDNGITSRGEDDEDPRSETSPHGDALPGTHGTDPFGPDRLLSYPQTFSSDCEFITQDGRLVTAEMHVRELVDCLRKSTGLLPGDQDAETTHRHPKTDNVDSVVPTVAETAELPQEHSNPSARSDYYDHMKMGYSGDEWPDEDSGSYSSEESDSLPGVMKNEVTMDNFLGALGNFWSGHETEDVSGPNGHPSEDFSENVDYDRSDLQNGGRIIVNMLTDLRPNTHQTVIENRSITSEALLNSKDRDCATSGIGNMSNRQATNTKLVGQFAQDFLKKFGKKDLTRRHVMSFLSSLNQPQFLASDIIRCLKLRHSVFVKDVLDEFPISKTASDGKLSMASIRDKLIQLEIDSMVQPDVSFQFRRCAANISNVIACLERLEARNG